MFDDYRPLSLYRERRGLKLAFHDADTDTDFLSRILVDTSGMRD